MSSSQLIGAIGGLIVGGLVAASSAGAQPAAAVMICTNPASGTTWKIHIDDRQATVDGYPATIGDSEISWFDPKDNGTYTLFRRTGKLRFIGPSSTGGYSVFDKCQSVPR